MDDEEGALADTVNCATAITPLGIAVVFKPSRMHLTEPVAGAHVSVLPAAVTDEDAVKVTPLMAVVE